ncbi:Xylose isomerase domain-containing protein TIM barrel [Planctomycetales bacterium 10988]|nr:Xylose isomerase domain-containing protein TIM barrel [Planctomycetales bacterium 10988]
MDRRQFLSSASASALGAAGMLGLSSFSKADAIEESSNRFTMNFAPHFGMFRNSAGRDLLSQLRFAAEHGFTAWEDNGMKSRSVEEQKQIAREMEKLDMKMGVISALRGTWSGVTFAGTDKAAHDAVLNAMKESIEVAKRVNTKYLTVVPGLADPKLPEGYQTANCIELLKRCCDILEPHGLMMVLEPLNHKTNHPGTFLVGSPQAYQICRAVDHPSCKILFDIYHQQITEGNLIVNIDSCWEEIGYFQCGDNPGRKEPGTGEIHYKNVFQHIQNKGFTGIMGMEHGNAQKGIEGEEALIQAYREHDPSPAAQQTS